jgi:hypothetical protein
VQAPELEPVLALALEPELEPVLALALEPAPVRAPHRPQINHPLEPLPKPKLKSFFLSFYSPPFSKN